jgi:5-methylcytosine-specific restriction endonuclease McrA
MSQAKKKIRQHFRDICFARDKYACVTCGMQSSPDKAVQELDCHHITDRSLMPHGGFVPENGISLCASCHLKAEEYHSTGVAHPGYAPADLYTKINSSHEKALEASQRLKS